MTIEARMTQRRFGFRSQTTAGIFDCSLTTIRRALSDERRTASAAERDGDWLEVPAEALERAVVAIPGTFEFGVEREVH